MLSRSIARSVRWRDCSSQCFDLGQKAFIVSVEIISARRQCLAQHLQNRVILVFRIVQIVADLSIASASLCRALFEVYLGSNSVVPEGRKEWANGARSLLESDKIRRQTRKGGTG